MGGWFAVKKALWLVLLLMLAFFMTSSGKSNKQYSMSQNNIVTNTGSPSSSILNVKILDISFYDENGYKLTPVDGWIHIGKNTKIIVSYKGSADQIDYIFTPTGTETYNSQKIIGNSFVGPNDTKAEFIWTPSADQTLGYINISINKGNYSLKSDLINVVNTQ
jgi:hypothetical protein